eukprot:TRINITY_DN113_c0_g1_i1.p1 TRINITY_DN113_c0_g1~~TRINITY_DN113_c0_g1_i1.p1  ORF type:complete len:246 (+),score=36.92 TRINITY_DN113_c0_g1_i1:119-856(+)
MARGVTMNCVKLCLLVGNLLILVVGLGLVGFGIYTKIKGANIDSFHMNSSEISIGVIIVGCFVVVLSFLGCCGSCTENRCLLILFFIVISVLLLAEGGLGITAFVLRDKVPDLLKDAWDKADNATKIDVQNDFSCCGWDSVSQSVGNCTFTDPCHDKLGSYAKKNLLWLALAAGIAGLIQLVSAIFSLCLTCHVSRISNDEASERLLEESALINREKQEKQRQDVAERHAYYKQKYQNYGNAGKQ